VRGYWADREPLNGAVKRRAHRVEARASARLAGRDSCHEAPQLKFFEAPLAPLAATDILTQFDVFELTEHHE
jgi:hypothetical protein